MPVLDENWIGIDADFRIVSGKPFAIRPVSYGATPVQDTGFREYEGAGADGNDTRGVRGDP